MKLSLMAFPLLVCWSVASNSIPPPPIDPKFEEASKAADGLSSLFGDWTGVQTQPGPYGSERVSFQRTFRRIGTAIEFVADNNGYKELGVIWFDPQKQTYQLQYPSQRYLRGVGETITLRRPDERSLSWTDSQAFGGALETTVRVDGNEWRERVERVSNGQRLTVWDVVLRRKP